MFRFLLFSVTLWAALVAVPTYAQEVSSAPDAEEQLPSPPPVQLRPPEIQVSLPAIEALPDRLLPEYRACIVDGVRYACYDEEGQLQLNTLEENARTWYTQWRINTRFRMALEAIVITRQAELTELHRVVQIQNARIEQLLTQVNEEIAAKNQYRAEAESTDVWPLIVGGAVALLGVGLATGVLVSAATN